MEFSIGSFEGPLDLLLALVKKEEMDIIDIDLHKITHQYLDVIHSSQNLNLDEGSEFIRMAAILILMKSKSLLPEVFEKEEEIEEEISKESLIQALAQHDQFLKAAEQLNQRLLLNRDIWSCPGMSFDYQDENREIEREGISSLVTAFRKILKQAHVYQMKITMPSVSQWIQCIQRHFVRGKTLFFSQLIREKQQPLLNQILLSFLSLLELGRMGFVSLSQKGEDIQVNIKKDIDKNVFMYKIVDSPSLRKKVVQ